MHVVFAVLALIAGCRASEARTHDEAVFGHFSSRAAALAWKLAVPGFRLIDIVPSGRRWLVVMPQVPVKNALSIAKEVAKAGFHIQFRHGSASK